MFTLGIGLRAGIVRLLWKLARAVGGSHESAEARPETAATSYPAPDEDPALSAPSSSGWAT